MNRWKGDASDSRSPGQVVRRLPDILVDRKFSERAGEISQNLLFLLSAGTVPKLELHWRTPTGLPGRQRCYDAGTDGRIAGRSEHVYPGRCIDENQPINPFAA